MSEIKVDMSEIKGDLISRKAVLDKLQEHHDFYINAYGDRFDFRDLAQKDDKARVDEITTIQAFIMELPTIPQTTTAEEKICPFNSDSEVTEYCVEGPCEHLKECPYAEELPTIPQTDSVLEDIKAEIIDKYMSVNGEMGKVSADILKIIDKHISGKEKE